MRLSCQNCEFEAAVDAFHEATGIEVRHTMGDVYSDKECPECGALAFPKDAEMALNRYIVIHEHRHGASTYEFRSPDDSPRPTGNPGRCFHRVARRA